MAQHGMLQNAKWMIGCKIVQSVLQMVIGMITARYLGPSNYGLISYAASLVSFAVPFMQLGLNQTLVLEYVSFPERQGTIAGTALGMNLLSSFACMICVTGFSALANPDENITIAVCALYSISLVFLAIVMLEYWFHAKLKSKYSSLAMLISYLVVSAYKIFLLLGQKSIFWFALVHSVEYGFTGLILVCAYKKMCAQKIGFSIKIACELFSRSKFYIISSLMVVVFQNTDHIMLKTIIGTAENGYYTAAVTCAGIAVFVYNAIIESAKPGILESHKRNRQEFESNVTCLYTAIIYLTLVQSICFFLLAKPIVVILFGKSYYPAVPVLQILVWQIIFSLMGTVRNVWILAEGKHNLLWLINLCGALVNIVLNALMIPHWGAAGAAFASVLTQFCTNLGIGFFFKPIRKNNALLVRGLNPRCLRHLYEMLRDSAKKS